MQTCGSGCATFAKIVTEADIVLFAAVRRQQRHPHNEKFAAGTIFKGLCVPKT
jgi:3-hydroxybutyryl-CoA dehydratase